MEHAFPALAFTFVGTAVALFLGLPGFATVFLITTVTIAWIRAAEAVPRNRTHSTSTRSSQQEPAEG
jgi:hypothetical protein